MPIIANVTNGILDEQYTTATQSSETTLGSELGYDQFLQLLCAEMQNQDPLEPTSNTDYVAQMATFSQLEATLSVKSSMEESLSATQQATANALIGKQVIVADAKSSTGYTSGIVDYVTVEDGEIKLSINDKLYPFTDFDSVSTNEYYEAIMKAKTMDGLISSLSDLSGLTTSYKSALEQIRSLYDGMTDYQKGFVSDSILAKLTQYESKMKELVEAENKAGETTDKSDETTDESGEGEKTEGTEGVDE